MKTLHTKLRRELRQLTGQLLAIALVMTGGIGTMVMALTNYQALSDTQTRYYSEYRFADVFASLKRAPDAMADAVRAVDGVRHVETRVTGFANLEIDGYDEPVTGQLVSLSGPGDPGLHQLYLRAGHLPDANDEVVISEAFANAHGFRPGDTLTAILNGRRQRLRISGLGLSPEFVYQIRPGDVFPDNQRFGVLWMRREPLATAFDLDGAFNDLILTLERDARAQDVIDTLDRLLEPYGCAGAYDRSLQVSHRFLDEELRGLDVMTRMFTVIFLSVTAFLLNVVIGRLISTQREQIAVLKAFGYSRLEVAKHYVELALLMVGFGVLPGLAMGSWLGRGMANLYMEFYSFPFLSWSLRPGVIALAFGFALVAAILGTIGGLRRAFALAPAEAMRPEAPPVFRRTLGERLGFGRLLDPAARMVLRNLERRPLRSTLSVLGIGMGVGILIMSRFQASAVDAMVEVQFGLAQRDDLAVTFVEPTASRSALDLASLPGVYAVEPFRTASVRLRNEHRSYRLALLGLTPGADLKRLLDDSLHPVSLPDDGLLLTDYLATMLDVEAGDTLGVEFLEGHRRTVSVLVTGVVREYLGVGAYASRATVNRLLDEGPSISGAWLGLDPRHRTQVIRELRAAPQVAAVTDRVATMQSFRDTMAENVLTFALIATLLAGSIAFGVVYNSARITLAERGRELASLRVLGYTRQEIRGLLLGELFALSFTALIPGFLIGYGLSALMIQAFASDLYRIPLIFDPSGFALAALVTLASTVLSALFVRRRLNRLDLVSVLKSRE
ncbi:FtsX-like permease family protein [uncultured Abyssibacter sp.]|uniref:ABC transporter permease n=1 Tax=uncultured Abyssibacter sp. TaxID=2320202 RepID=UPI0032B26B84